MPLHHPIPYLTDHHYYNIIVSSCIRHGRTHGYCITFVQLSATPLLLKPVGESIKPQLSLLSLTSSSLLLTQKNHHEPAVQPPTVSYTNSYHHCHLHSESRSETNHTLLTTHTCWFVHLYHYITSSDCQENPVHRLRC